MTLAVGLFIIAALGLYMVYQGQAKKQGAAEADLAEVQAEIPVLVADKQDLETELSGLEAELAQWQDQISQLESDLSQSISDLSQTEARFPSLVESIEYDEALFAFAQANNLEIASLGVTEPIKKNVGGITYLTTSFSLKVRGEVADILDFINTIVNDDDFQTAIIKPVSVLVPRPLTEQEKEGLTEEQIKERETPSASITMLVYSYQGE
jgi:hypothetical protein